jgi:hypothetical protein
VSFGLGLWARADLRCLPLQTGRRLDVYGSRIDRGLGQRVVVIFILIFIFGIFVGEHDVGLEHGELGLERKHVLDGCFDICELVVVDIRGRLKSLSRICSAPARVAGVGCSSLLGFTPGSIVIENRTGRPVAGRVGAAASASEQKRRSSNVNGTAALHGMGSRR